jgi:multiple sugar transport system ATP-binding protein
VAQNIAFSLRLARKSKQEIRQRVGETARLLGLEDLLDRRPKQLSGGQRQRVAMGRAIIRQPQAFLMDEPLSNLDAQLRVQMRGEIEALQERLGVTTVYVTHDQVEAMTMGDRVAVLRAGELQQVDTPTNVYDNPANLFVAGFIGSPPMNLVEGTIEGREGDGVTVRLGSLAVPLGAEAARRRGLDSWVGRQVIVGVRPEDLRGAGDGAVADGRERLSLSATVARVEALGSSLLAYFRVDAPPARASGVVDATGGEELEDVPLVAQPGTTFCATFETRSAIRSGQQVEVVADVQRLHFFDPETENALGAGAK